MAHKPIEELRSDLVNASDVVDVGATYRHSKTGGLYIVEGLGIYEPTDEVVVTYCPKDAADVEFVRPLSSFVEVINIDGNFLPRFELRED